MRSAVLFVASLAALARAPVPRQVLSVTESPAFPTDSSIVESNDPDTVTAPVLDRAAVPRQVLPTGDSSVQPTDTSTPDLSGQPTDTATLDAVPRQMSTDESSVQPTDTFTLDPSAEPTDTATLDPNATDTAAQPADTSPADPDDTDTGTERARAAVPRQDSGELSLDTPVQPTDATSVDPNATDAETAAAQPTNTSVADPNAPDVAAGTALARAAVLRQVFSTVQPTDTSTLDPGVPDAVTATATGPIRAADTHQAPSTQEPAPQPTDSSDEDPTTDSRVAGEPIGTDGVLTTSKSAKIFTTFHREFIMLCLAANAAVNSAPYTVPEDPATFFWTSGTIVPGVSTIHMR